MKYFLGIDPGIRKLGYALIDERHKIIDAGILLSEKEGKTDLREENFKRMYDIYNFFEKLLDENEISGVGIEKLFFTTYNQANAEFVYGVRGAILCLCLEKKIKIFEWTPKELKKMITGNGNAEKILVQQFIMKIFGLKELPQFNDTADALGFAYAVSRVFK